MSLVYLEGVYMKYLLAFSVVCLSMQHPLSAVDQAVAVSVDKCIPLVTAQDVEAFISMNAEALSLSSGQKKLTSDQMKACKHLIQQGKSCDLPVELSNEILSGDLQVMEILAAGGKTSFSQEEVNQIRLQVLDKIGLSEEEIEILLSLDDQIISQEIIAIIQKYIDLAQDAKTQIAFNIEQRLSILKVVAENISIFFSKEQGWALRKVELLVNGLLQKEIDLLMSLVDQIEDRVLEKEEVEVLKKWISLEGLFSARNIIDFSSLSKLHALLQIQSTPPFSLKELKRDESAFQNQLKMAPFMEQREIEVLKKVAENITGYLSQDQGLSPFQVIVIQKFMNQILQFGRVPDLTPLEVGQLLQLVEVRVEFQNIVEELKQVRFIEQVISNFNLEQKKVLDELVQKKIKRELLSINKNESDVLHVYILRAKTPGALNGFGFQYRVALFSIVEGSIENKEGKFTASDLDVLRRVEQQNNGFSDKDIYQIKVITKKLEQSKPLSLEELELLREFTRIEKQVGLGTIIHLKQTSLIYGAPQDKSPEPERGAVMGEESEKPSFQGRREAASSTPSNVPSDPLHRTQEQANHQNIEVDR